MSLEYFVESSKSTKRKIEMSKTHREKIKDKGISLKGDSIGHIWGNWSIEINNYLKKYSTSGQDGGVGRHTAYSHNQKKDNNNLKTENNQN